MDKPDKQKAAVTEDINSMLAHLDDALFSSNLPPIGENVGFVLVFDPKGKIAITLDNSPQPIVLEFHAIESEATHAAQRSS